MTGNERKKDLAGILSSNQRREYTGGQARERSQRESLTPSTPSLVMSGSVGSVPLTSGCFWDHIPSQVRCSTVDDSARDRDDNDDDHNLSPDVRTRCTSLDPWIITGAYTFQSLTTGAWRSLFW